MKPLKDKGDCDCCPTSVGVILYELNGMKMCEGCYTQNMSATERALSANEMVQKSRTIDASIEIKPDVFRATTVAAIDVMAAIQHDASIPEADKNYAMALESLRRFQHMQKVVFDLKAELNAKENEMRAWQVQIHTFAAKVEGARKEIFKNHNMNYQPKSAPKPRTQSAKAPSTFKKPTKVELFDAAQKYNVPMAMVAMTANARNMTAEEAARAVSANIAAAKSTPSN